MPSFYPNGYSRQLPLTPPEYYGNSFDPSCKPHHYGEVLPMEHAPAALPRYDPNSYTTANTFKQLPHVPQIPHEARPASAYTNDSDIQSMPSSYASKLKTSTSYAAANAPILPHARAQEPSIDQYGLARPTQAQSAPKSKEEKVVGGVAAHLDYDMEQMAKFVSEMAQGMYELYDSRICLADIDIIRSVNPSSSVSADFHNYVVQILSSTRLPSSTILLSLYYLATRMTTLSAQGRVATGKGQMYRMLTTSLMLGSKFLDDNTFQNRSWSEVSKIPVTEINVLELEWLLAIGWNMHINPEDSQGFMMWRKHWDHWQAKQITISFDSLKLTPLDVNIQRQRSIGKHHSPATLYPPVYDRGAANTSFKEQFQPQWANGRRYNDWTPFRPNTEYSPPSAPDTTPNTPEWYGRHSGEHHRTLQQYSSAALPRLPQMLPSTLQQTPYASQYSAHYTASSWQNHVSNCGCEYCLPRADRFSMAPGYGAQSIVG